MPLDDAEARRAHGLYKALGEVVHGEESTRVMAFAIGALVAWVAGSTTDPLRFVASVGEIALRTVAAEQAGRMPRTEPGRKGRH